MFIPNLVVFSHLRWRYVQARPQHLLGRLAGKWHITFIEEPVCTEAPPFLELVDVGEDLTVLVPHTPLNAPGFHDDQHGVLQPMIEDWFSQRGIQQAVVWLYTPMALPWAQALDPLCLVYDCIVELSAFQDAPRQLRQREKALMEQAALVLTGSPSLYDTRRTLNPNVHCIPSSVDAAHFSSTRLDHTSQAAWDVQALQGHLGGARLGYFGLIDERIDLFLLALIADQHPEWQIVMVGPVVELAASTLPRRANIHWLGMQSYKRLPYFLSGWDVCLMPFALIEATRSISPTQTLEYMAGGKPIVSTALPDVVSMHGMAVEVAYTPASFVRACERLLNASEDAREVRRCDMSALVAAGSWERNADKIDTLLWEAREAALDIRLTDHRGLIPRAEQHMAPSMSRA